MGLYQVILLIIYFISLLILQLKYLTCVRFYVFYQFSIAFNYKEKEHTRQKYKKKLALFEENCALIPYLSSTMAGNYKPPSERSIEFEFKLHRFLTLGDLPGGNGLL